MAVREKPPTNSAAGILARNAIVPLTELAASFRQLPEDIAMAQAGSIVAFLIRRGGVGSVRDLWRQHMPPSDHPLGPDGPQVESAWRTHLRSVTPATLDLARGLPEGC